MNQYIRTVFLWILVMVTVCSCSPVQPSVSNDLEISFRELISIDDINKCFQMHVFYKIKVAHLGKKLLTKSSPPIA
jgi:hypothetical protein